MPAATPSAVAGATITGLDMAAYLVSDAARAIAFYRDVLGLEPTAIDEQGRGAEFALPDGSVFGVWRAPDGPTSGASNMFAVADIQAAVTQFRARGLELSPPMETPGCWMSFGQDPDGNGIIIHQRKAHGG